MYQYLRQPWSAALFAAAVTAFYRYITVNMNGKKELPNHVYLKPAALVAILVYFIVHFGQTYSEPLLKI